MEVILLGDVEKLGKKGDVIDVKGGYFRNFLLPRGKAVLLDAGARRALEERKRVAGVKQARGKEKALALSAKIAGRSLTLRARAGQEGKLFGSVTNQEIARCFEEKGLVIDKHQIELEPIKNTGTYTVKIRLHSEVECSVELNVVGE